jgi:Zn-dependent M16 (insulinase) family peptidase
MKKSLVAIAIILAMGLLSGCGGKTSPSDEPLKIGAVIHGFKLEKKQAIPELDGEGLLFRHEKSGARLLKIVSGDDNKVFSVAFKTPPPDDTGIPHIMEHSVLNGSESFPVKSPFDVLSQGSLKTFLNAMTSSDFTIYPVASRNDKDFSNLMHVYLDAVYKPLLHKDPKILQQEGWHYELESADSPLVYKGVVYNEMKGSFSAPQRQLGYLMDKNLFPDNQYGNSSGGYPEAIPDLTHEQFKAFHQKYYHPSNSYIYLYGNGDLDKELAFIHEKYLSAYDKITVDSEIPLHKPLAEPKVVHGQYGLPEGSPTEGKTFIARSSVYGRNTDQEQNIALDILAEALVNHQAAPLRLALQKAGIGQDVSASVDSIQQPVFGVSVTNAKAADQDTFDKIYRETLQEVVDKGFDKTTLEGIINRQEFQLREGRGSFTGIMGAMMAPGGWMFADNPFVTLSFNAELVSIRSKLDQKYFENLIQKVLLDNPHVVTVVMEPKAGLEKELAAETERKLADIKAKMSPQEIEAIVKQTRELVAFQQRRDDPETLKTIPLLEIADIEKKQEDLPLTFDTISDTPLWFFDTFTKGIVYLDLYFDAGAIDQELIPYAQLYNELVGLMSTEKYAYGDLENQINLHTGGLSTSQNTLTVERDDEQLKAYLVVRGKVMPDKLGQLTDLINQELLHSKWDDEARLNELLMRTKAQFEQRLAYNGLGIAMTRIGSYMFNQSAYRDLISGYGYHQFLCDLLKKPDLKQIAAKLKTVQSKLINAAGLKLGVTCQAEQLKVVKETLPAMLAALPKEDFKSVSYAFPKIPLNEGFQDASKVQYVMKGGNYQKLGHRYSGKMDVLSQLLSTVYLQNTIRVQGGAYGGFAVMDDSGMLAFASYRDPNLRKTVENYRGAGQFLTDLKLDERDLRRLIIGTISNRDYPLNPNQKGYVAVRRFLRGDTLEKLQQERDEILSTSLEDLKAYAKMVRDVMDQDIICVVGNEKKIAEDKDLFKKILPLRQ